MLSSKKLCLWTSSKQKGDEFLFYSIFGNFFPQCSHRRGTEEISGECFVFLWTIRVQQSQEEIKYNLCKHKSSGAQKWVCNGD